MEFIIFFFFIFLEIYTGFLIIILLVHLIRRKRLPWSVLMAEVLCIGSFFYLKYLLDDHKLIFTGSYNNDKVHWESGLANLSVYMLNLLILLGIFIITQIIFWILYSKRFRRLNPKMDKIDMDSFLKPTEQG